MRGGILARIAVVAVITFFSGCAASRYAKLSSIEDASLKAHLADEVSPYQVVYSGMIDIEGMRAAVRLLAAFDGEFSRIELVPISGAISLFSMARRANEAEILLPSVARGQRISDLNQFLVQKIRTASFVRYLPAILAQQLPSDCVVCSEALSCSDNLCRLGANVAEVFEINRASARLTKAIFRDRFQLNDRVVFEFDQKSLMIIIPELNVKLKLEEISRGPLSGSSKRRFFLDVPDAFELIG